MNLIEELLTNSKKFKKIVIWGLRRKFHTHRYIYKGYYDVLRKVGIPAVWVEDERQNAGIIERGDLILSAEVQGKMVSEKKEFEDYSLPVRNDVFYCLHNYKEIFTKNVNKEKLVNLQVYVDDAEKFEKLYEAVHYDKFSKTLFQPWGTNLMPHEFKKPVFSKSKFVFWVGSVWNNAQNQGNLNEIGDLVKILMKNKLYFKRVRFVPDFLNMFFVRHSRIAPAVAGAYQVKKNYLPCRMFKNISYGQLGFSNVEKFNDIFKGCIINNSELEKTVKEVLSLNKQNYLDMIRAQQSVCKNYTYIQHLNNIFKIL